jgi:hypothetical protein
MTTNSAIMDVRLPAARTPTGRVNNVVAVVRRRISRPRWSRERPYLKISNSYRISDGRRRYEGASNWIHSHH